MWKHVRRTLQGIAIVVLIVPSSNLVFAQHLKNIKTQVYSTPAPAHTTPATLQSGFFVQFKRRSESSERNIFIYATDGSNAKWAIAFSPPNALIVRLTAVSIGPDHLISVSGLSIHGSEKRPFVATLDFSGTIRSTYSTYPYLASEVVRGPDGTMWTVGVSQSDSSDPNGNKVFKNYNTLRHYSRDGIIIDSYLPRWGAEVESVTYTRDGQRIVTASLKARDTMTPLATGSVSRYRHETGLESNQKRIRRTYLALSPNGIVVLDTRNHKLFEWDGSTRSLSEWRVSHLADDMTVNGFAVLANGHIYASRSNKLVVSKDGIVGISHSRGIYELAPDSSGMARWASVIESSDSSPLHFHILGGFANALLYTVDKAFPVAVNWATIAND